MEQRSRVIFFIMSFLLVGCLFFAQAQDEDGSISESASFSVSAESASIDISDRNPCSFRGQFLSHGESLTLDPCTVCTCKNGSTTCHITSCPAEAGCEPFDIVVIPEECCPQCPYKMYVENTINLYDKTFEFTEGSTKKIRFGLDIEVDRHLTSRTVRGENLWKLTAWISPNEDGSGPRFSERDNVFNEKDAAKEYSKPQYPPWQWAKLRYTMQFTGGSCADYRYFCVQFGQADDPQPLYDLSFTFQAVDNEEERLIDCDPLGEWEDVTTSGNVTTGLVMTTDTTMTTPVDITTEPTTVHNDSTEATKMMSTSPVCDEDLTLDVTAKAYTRNKIRLIVTWNITDKPSCRTANKEIIVVQKDRDRCEDLSISPEHKSTINSLSGTRVIKVIVYPNSLYAVTLQVNCCTPCACNKTVQIRTPETEPTAAPTNVSIITKGTAMKFQWEKPPCGERNGNIIGYEVVFHEDGKGSRKDRTKNNFKYYFSVEPGGKYNFKVRTLTARGRGPRAKWETE